MESIQNLLKFSIINIDKPSGPTSYSVSDYIRKIFDVNKTSHFGTLDPQVSGVLPVALGRACRLNEYFMHKNKTYVGIMRLHADVDDKLLQDAIREFLGKIKQMPPVRSSVKRQLREREIISFNILERSGKDVLFETEVQAGTYIRTLCVDIGKKIGGAHMLELRRVKAGIFEEKGSYSLYDLDKALASFKEGDDSLLRKILLPAQDLIKKVIPCFKIKKEVLKKVLTGSPIFPSFILNAKKASLKENDKLAIFCNDDFVGCYKYVGKENLFAVPEFVFN